MNDRKAVNSKKEAGALPGQKRNLAGHDAPPGPARTQP